MVGNFRNLIYVHLINSVSGEQKLSARKAYEWREASYGVNVSIYYTDNGRYA